MAVFRTLLFVFFIGLSIACAPTKNSKSSNNDRNSRKTTSPACFLGLDGNGRECLATTSIGATPGYEYVDPSDPSFPGYLNPNQYHRPVNALEISAHNTQLPLGPHFVISEFLQAHKGPLGLVSPLIVEKLEEIRQSLGQALHITSAFRSPGYNSQIPGAAKWSRHMYGDAVDFYVDGTDFETLKELCLSLGASFYQIYARHIHCDWRDSPLPRAFFGNTLASSHFHKVRQDYLDHTHIHLEKSKHRPVLSVDHPAPEDNADELTYHWEVTLPNGRIRHYSKAKIKLPRRQGQYKTTVSIGGSLRASFEFFWSR